MDENNKIENTGNKKWLIIGIVAVVVIVGVFLIFSFANGEDDITGEIVEGEEERKLYVVTSPWEPYMWEENGEYTGFAVDLLDRIMTELNISYKFEILPWVRAEKLGDVGEADALLVVSHSEKRLPYYYSNEEQIKFYEGEIEMPEFRFTESVSGFFVRKALASSFKFDSVEQVAQDGYLVGLNTGYEYGIPVELWNTVRIISEEQAMLDLDAGLIDVYHANKLVGLSIIKKLNLTDELIFIEDQKGKEVNAMYILFSRASDYPNLEQINKDVHRVTLELKESGEYDEIVRRYTG
jgi:ABC-type amino acid transport substrate-binding protein